jgi:Flp pilus assembly protein TadG
MRRRRSSQKGAAAVEFAIVLLPLILITFGIIEFGTYLYNQQVITNASREGARAGIVASSPRVTPAAIKSIVDNYAADNLVTFGTSNSPGVIVTGYASDADFGDDLTIQVTYNYSFLVIPNFIAMEKVRTMQATTVMRYE